MAAIGFGPCCFCGEDIEKTAIDPCRVMVTISESDKKWQVWHCHGACFRARLATLPDAPGLFEPNYF